MDYRKLYKEHYCIEFGPEYAIHHIDGDRENNDISNLILLPESLHKRWHNVQGAIVAAGENPGYALTYTTMVNRCRYDTYTEQLHEIWQQCVPWIGRKYLEDIGALSVGGYAFLRGKKEWEKFDLKTT